MGFHAMSFAEATGLHWEKKHKLFWGNLQGFPVYLKWYRRRNLLLLEVHGDCANESVQADSELLVQQWPGLVQMQYQNNILQAVISMPSKEPNRQVQEHLEAVLAFAAAHGMEGCCLRCKTGEGLQAYHLNGKGVTFCSGCADTVQKNLEQHQTKCTQMQSRPMGIMAGTVAGLVLLIGLTWVTFEFGYSSVLIGFAAVWLGTWLMKRFGKKIPKVAAVTFSALMCIAVVATPLVYVAHRVTEIAVTYETDVKNEIASYEAAVQFLATEGDLLSAVGRAELGERIAELKSDIGYYRFLSTQPTTLDALLHMPQWMNMETFGGVLRVALLGLISVLVAIWTQLLPQSKADAGENTFEVLQ